jgi:hypothetical protein
LNRCILGIDALNIRLYTGQTLKVIELGAHKVLVVAGLNVYLVKL